MLRPAIPTIITFKDVIKAGASDFVTKPFSVDELEAKLNRIIRERILKKELKEKWFLYGMCVVFSSIFA